MLFFFQIQYNNQNSMLFQLFIFLCSVILVVCLVIVVIPYVKTKYIHFKYRKNSRHIFYPLAGYSATLVGGTPSNTTLDKLVTTKGKDEKFIVTNFFTKPCIVVTDWKMAKQFLFHHQKYVVNDVDFLFQQVYCRRELITHQNWKKYKKILSGTMNFQFFQIILKDVRIITQRQLNSVSFNVPFKIYDQPFKITQQVISYAFFSKSINLVKIDGVGLIDKLRDIFNFTFETVVDPVFLFRNYLLRKPSQDWGIFLSKKQTAVLFELRRVIAQFRVLIQQRIKQHKSRPESQQKYWDFVQAFIKFYVAQQNYNKNLIFEQIVDQFTVFLGAGSHSTSVLTGTCLYHLAKYPQWYRKLEIIANELPKQYSLKELNKYNDITYFIKEATRMHPLFYAGFPRQCKQDIKIQNFLFEKDTYLTLGIYDIMHNPQYFESPYQFRPERWNSEINKQSNLPFYVFGGGPRNCMGEQIAMIEIKTILIQYIRRARITLNQKVQYKIKIEVSYLAQNQELIILEQK